MMPDLTIGRIEFGPKTIRAYAATLEHPPCDLDPSWMLRQSLQVRIQVRRSQLAVAAITRLDAAIARIEAQHAELLEIRKCLQELAK